MMVVSQDGKSCIPFDKTFWLMRHIKDFEIDPKDFDDEFRKALVKGTFWLIIFSHNGECWKIAAAYSRKEYVEAEFKALIGEWRKKNLDIVSLDPEEDVVEYFKEKNKDVIPGFKSFKDKNGKTKILIM